MLMKIGAAPERGVTLVGEQDVGVVAIGEVGCWSKDVREWGLMAEVLWDAEMVSLLFTLSLLLLVIALPFFNATNYVELRNSLQIYLFLAGSCHNWISWERNRMQLFCAR
jgi:hypothetical protein